MLKRIKHWLLQKTSWQLAALTFASSLFLVALPIVGGFLPGWARLLLLVPYAATSWFTLATVWYGFDVAVREIIRKIEGDE